MKRILLSAAVALTLGMAALPAFADLHSARAAGQIGEKADGYVTALDPSAQALADQVNAGRKTQYESEAAKKGQPASVIGALYAKIIIEKLEPGAKYQGADGSWKTK